jgi:prephenate dehydrogenase (NADP+)
MSSAEYYASLPINVTPDASPALSPEYQPTIGLIGMGAMGRMYARYLQAGWCRFVSGSCVFFMTARRHFLIRIHVCDLPEKLDQLKADYAGRFVLVSIRDSCIDESARLSEHLSHERWTCCFEIV